MVNFLKFYLPFLVKVSYEDLVYCYVCFQSPSLAIRLQLVPPFQKMIIGFWLLVWLFSQR